MSESIFDVRKINNPDGEFVNLSSPLGPQYSNRALVKQDDYIVIESHSGITITITLEVLQTCYTTRGNTVMGERGEYNRKVVSYMRLVTQPEGEKIWVYSSDEGSFEHNGNLHEATAPEGNYIMNTTLSIGESHTTLANMETHYIAVNGTVMGENGWYVNKNY